MTPILACDPGKAGGWALQNSEGVFLTAMQSTEGDCVDFLRGIYAMNPGLVVWIERVGGFVGKAQPASRAFTFGRGVGVLIGALMALGIPIKFEVPPATWIKFHGLGTRGDRSKTEWKRHLLAKAQQLYPMVDGITLKTADALLILDYAKGQEFR